MGVPVITVSGEGIAETWEKSLVALWEQGGAARTEYDAGGEPAAKDACMVMSVADPFAEPRIHLGFGGGIEDLEKYRQEVIAGVHDHWIAPEEGKWTYTYHERLTAYLVSDSPRRRDPARLPFKPVDQLAGLVERLARAPHSRRAQAITWIPLLDPGTDDPPCLQRVWCRVFPHEKGEHLQMHTHWRSRDAYRAAYMNIYGLTALQRLLARRLSRRLGREIAVGPYVDISDSYHIYGASFREFEARFLKLYRERVFHDEAAGRGRTLRSDDPAVRAGLAWGRAQLAREREQGSDGRADAGGKR